MNGVLIPLSFPLCLRILLNALCSYIYFLWAISEMREYFGLFFAGKIYTWVRRNEQYRPREYFYSLRNIKKLWLQVQMCRLFCGYHVENLSICLDWAESRERKFSWPKRWSNMDYYTSDLSMARWDFEVFPWWVWTNVWENRVEPTILLPLAWEYSYIIDFTILHVIVFSSLDFRANWTVRLLFAF